MKTSLYFLLVFIMVSCSPSKKNEASAIDSTQNVVDTVNQIPEESAVLQEEESPASEEKELFSGHTNNFPNYSVDALTNDSLEAEINNRIGELLQVYDTMQYAKITSSYSWERPYYARGQEGEVFLTTETEGETKTWFFDRSNQLRGFSSEFNADSDYPYTKSILYLFSNDSLIAISEYRVDASEVTVVDHVRVLASQCPRCGISSRAGYQENEEVSYLSEKELAVKQQEFYESIPALIQILKTGRKTATKDDYDFTFSINRTKEGNEEDKSKAITYPVTFTVTKELYPNYILKQ
jgi:hypothetical protein